MTARYASAEEAERQVLGCLVASDEAFEHLDFRGFDPEEVWSSVRHRRLHAAIRDIQPDDRPVRVIYEDELQRVVDEHIGEELGHLTQRQRLSLISERSGWTTAELLDLVNERCRLVDPTPFVLRMRELAAARRVKAALSRAHSQLESGVALEHVVADLTAVLAT